MGKGELLETAATLLFVPRYLAQCLVPRTPIKTENRGEGLASRAEMCESLKGVHL